MKRVLLLIIALGAFVTSFAQSTHRIMFYNVENFFDTIDDPNVNDDEFTPNGSNKWTQPKYDKKLKNVERVIYSLSQACGAYPSVIGFSEVEVRSVLEDIAATPKLLPAGYNVVHYDSPERRGVDVAFLYRPDKFQLEGSRAVKVVIPQRPDFKTRDILTMWGSMDNEPFFFMVMHWSSRWGGAKQSEFLRVANAMQVKSIADSVSFTNPRTKIVIMGDMNDDPTDKSMYKVLKAKGDIKVLGHDELYNPFYSMLKMGYGTLTYNGDWNLFDNIIVSKNLAQAPKGELALQPSTTNSKVYANIYKPYFLIQDEGPYRGSPLRSFSGGTFIGGFSDHLPVYITISNK